ncbi:YgaP family membrane protein [Consotaella aegiceratis]|uniref:YgaP family membrane protein n=1 Tax=Consotaella aegiceratis TaxID=3097961 RepID=UPI002F416F55
MTVDRAVLALAGTITLLSLALGYVLSPYWYLLTVFVGANQIQAAFTGFCPAALIFKKLGVKPGVAFS